MHIGASQRTVFEDRQDARYFLALLARAVRRGEIEVHAFCLLSNHFHLLVRSPTGQLSRAMKRILNAYVRYFNRRRRRSGALFRNRFTSKPVTSMAYRRVLVTYMDENPVYAGLTKDPQSYPWGSAACYARHAGPLWLTRSWIESEVRSRARKLSYDPADYAACFLKRLPAAVRSWIERRLRGKAVEDDQLDNLLDAAPPRVRAWMERQARQADGMAAGHCLVPAEWVLDLCNAREGLTGAWSTQRGVRGVRTSALDLALPGLLSNIAGLTQMEISLRIGLPRSTVQHRLHAHRQALRDDVGYAEQCAELAHECLRRLKGI